MAKLEVSHVTKYFDGKKIIEDVSISLGENELVCLLGVSGVGKTTLFNIISGLTPPEEGKVTLNGTDASALPHH